MFSVRSKFNIESPYSIELQCIFTPRVSDGCNSFAIVILSFCLSVCLALTAKRTDIRTWFSVCRSSGRISRSSSKVKVIGQRSMSPGQKTFFNEMYHSETAEVTEWILEKWVILKAGSLSMWNNGARSDPHSRIAPDLKQAYKNLYT